MEITVNYLAVFAAAVAAFGVGWIWYGVLFQKQWMSLMGFTMESMRAMGLSPIEAMSMGFVSTLVMVYVLAHFIELVGATTVPLALQLAFWAWLGFTATVQFGAYLWEGRSVKLVFINGSQTLVAMLLAAAILGSWQ